MRYFTVFLIYFVYFSARATSILHDIIRPWKMIKNRK
jgi:hypothetical protein